MKTIEASVCNKDQNRWDNIKLPATYEEIWDLTQRLGISTSDKTSTVHYFLGEHDLLAENELECCNIYELNHFATLVEGLNNSEQEIFKAICEITCEETADINHLINIALNMNTLNIALLPAKTDAELGEHFVSNELCLELEKMSDSQLLWIQENIDYSKVGKKMREEENGVLTDGGYLEMNEELKPLYDGKYIAPIPADYIFKLEIALAPIGDKQNDKNTVTLKLPANNVDYETVLKQTGATNLSDCVFYEFKSVVPQLAEMFCYMGDFENLNQLAINLQYFKENGELLIYKAMLETLRRISLDDAIIACEYVSDFKLEQGVHDISDYAKQQMKNIDVPLKDEFLKSVNFFQYAGHLMEHNGAKRTAYGIVTSNDGIILSKKLAENQNPTLTMTME